MRPFAWGFFRSLSPEVRPIVIEHAMRGIWLQVWLRGALVVFVLFTLGLVAGYLGRRWDRIIMRVADVQQAIPALVLAVAVAAVLKPSITNLIVVLAVTTWFTFARVVRSEVLSLREMLFVESARVVGADDARIIGRHILPNAAASIIVIATLMVGNLILFEASLSFLGVGVPLTTPTWGRMVFDGIEYVATAWWIALFPGVTIAVEDLLPIPRTALEDEEEKSAHEIALEGNAEFVEVFVDAPLSVCEARDPKHLYKKARAGHIRDFTGIDAPYEAPDDPEIVVHTDRQSIDESVATLLEQLLPRLRAEE